ncbi:MAG: sugar acetyltransferase, partial [Verrucomicrobiota bacterium]
MKQLYIYCAGGFGREVMDVARRLNASAPRWDEIFFIDDVCKTTSVHGARVFKFDDGENRASLERAEVVIANGEPAARQAIRVRVENAGIQLGTVVDPSTLVSET